MRQEGGVETIWTVQVTKEPSEGLYLDFCDSAKRVLVSWLPKSSLVRKTFA